VHGAFSQHTGAKCTQRSNGDLSQSSKVHDLLISKELSALGLDGAAIKQTIIFEAELLALIVSFVLWRNLVTVSWSYSTLTTIPPETLPSPLAAGRNLLLELPEQLLKVEDIFSCFCEYPPVKSCRCSIPHEVQASLMNVCQHCPVF
jgi:hypothetical protein